MQGRGEAFDHLAEARVRLIHVAGEIGLALLGGAGDESGDQSDANAAADVADEADHAGDLIIFLARDVDIGQDVGGNENEGEAEDLIDAQHGGGAEIDAKGQVGAHVIERGGGDAETKTHHGALIEFGNEKTGERHHEHHGEAAGGERFAGADGGVAEEQLQELGDEHGGAIEHDAQDEHETHGDAEIALFQERQFDDRVGMVPFPNDPSDQQNDRGDERRSKQVRGEPIDFLAFVENDLQGADAEGDEAQADVIDADALLADFFLLQVGRIVDEPVGEIQRNNADGDVDVENPAPTEIVGDPAADGGADGGGDDDGHAVDGEGHAAFGGCESIGEDGLFAGLQAAAGGSL